MHCLLRNLISTFGGARLSSFVHRFFVSCQKSIALNPKMRLRFFKMSSCREVFFAFLVVVAINFYRRVSQKFLKWFAKTTQILGCFLLKQHFELFGSTQNIFRPLTLFKFCQGYQDKMQKVTLQMMYGALKVIGQRQISDCSH